MNERSLTIASLSDVGRVRSSNQDDVGEFTNEGGARLVVVADGMGGHAGGEVASATCIEALGAYFQQAQETPETLLRQGLVAANDEVYRKGNEQPSLFGMGTTAVVLLIEPEGGAWVAHVGDSRAYQLHEGQLVRLTDDHSWVQEQVRLERLTEEEAETHPRRNALLRSIGVDAGVEVDVRELELAPGDRVLLCSDGLWGEVDEGTIGEVLRTYTPEQGARELVDLANAAGGRDNVTVAVVALPEGFQPKKRAGGPLVALPTGLRSLRFWAPAAAVLLLLIWLLTRS